MEDRMKQMQEEGRRNLKILNEKKIGRLIANDIRMKRLKKAILTTKLAAIILVSAAVGEKVGEKINQPETKSSMYSSIETTSLSQASDEVIIDYVNSSFGDFSKYVGGSEAGLETVESVKESYYVPVMRSYNDYEETKDETYHDEFKKNVQNYEERVSQFSNNFSFDKSIYKYAKSIDGEVCVPYTGIIDDSTIPANAHVIDRVVYVPTNELTNEEAKALGND